MNYLQAEQCWCRLNIYYCSLLLKDNIFLYRYSISKNVEVLICYGLFPSWRGFSKPNLSSNSSNLDIFNRICKDLFTWPQAFLVLSDFWKISSTVLPFYFYLDLKWRNDIETKNRQQNWLNLVKNDSTGKAGCHLVHFSGQTICWRRVGLSSPHC